MESKHGLWVRINVFKPLSRMLMNAWPMVVNTQRKDWNLGIYGNIKEDALLTRPRVELVSAGMPS